MSVVAVLAAYLVGAVPIGWLVARAFGVGDIRRHGSGTIGATNVLRTARTLARPSSPCSATCSRATWRCWLGSTLGGDQPAVSAAAAVAAVAGNCWSVFLGFRGGKGVATGLGALLRLVPLATLAAVPVFVAIVASFRYVSLGSVLATACVPLGALALGYPARLRAGHAGDRRDHHRPASRQHRSPAGGDRVAAGR